MGWSVAGVDEDVVEEPGVSGSRSRSGSGVFGSRGEEEDEYALDTNDDRDHAAGRERGVSLSCALAGALSLEAHCALGSALPVRRTTPPAVLSGRNMGKAIRGFLQGVGLGEEELREPKLRTDLNDFELPASAFGWMPTVPRFSSNLPALMGLLRVLLAHWASPPYRVPSALSGPPGPSGRPLPPL